MTKPDDYTRSTREPARWLSSLRTNPDKPELPTAQELSDGAKSFINLKLLDKPFVRAQSTNKRKNSNLVISQD